MSKYQDVQYDLLKFAQSHFFLDAHNFIENGFGLVLLISFF